MESQPKWSLASLTTFSETKKNLPSVFFLIMPLPSLEGYILKQLKLTPMIWNISWTIRLMCDLWFPEAILILDGFTAMYPAKGLLVDFSKG